MNAHMTGRAILIARIGHVMVRCLSGDAVSPATEVPSPVVAFQAQSKHHRAPQQSRIGRPVRSMAGFASVDTNAEMLEYEGPPFIGVAFEARLFVRHGLLDVARARGHPPGGSKRPVRIVAVRTRHHSFLHAVLEGHRELRAHVGMTLFTESGLRLAQERAHGLRAMNRMAAGTCHAVESMLRTTDIGP